MDIQTQPDAAAVQHQWEEHYLWPVIDFNDDIGRGMRRGLWPASIFGAAGEAILGRKFQMWELAEAAKAPPPKSPRPAASSQTAKGAFQFIGTDTLMAKSFAPIKWIVPGYVPEGLTLLAGKQKLGKTWMAIDWAAAIASGGKAMGIQCEQGDVLYIDLENGPRRIKRRLEAMWPLALPGAAMPNLTRLNWANESAEIGPLFLSALDKWHDGVKAPRLVIVDVFQRIKPAGSAARNAYENDYSALSGLQQWATERGVAVVLLHHLKKGGGAESDDPFEKLSGSNGLSACADTTLVLDRNSQGCTLYGRGRDVEEIDSAVTFDKLTFRWTVVGNVTDIRRSDERGNIMNALAEAQEPLSPTAIADVTGQKSGNVRRLLMGMVKAGEARKQGRGLYALPTLGVEKPPPGNNGNKVTTGEDDTPGTKVTNPLVAPVTDGGSGLVVTVGTVVTAPPRKARKAKTPTAN